MSLNPPRQPSGPTASFSRPDPEALLLEAVRHRHHHESLDRLQRCVHRRGLEWLDKFQTLTLPALEGYEAAAWFRALLADGSGHAPPGAGFPPGNLALESITNDSHHLVTPADPPGGGEDQAWIEQRATAAVDGAIASMLAEFPELIPPGPPLAFVLPLTVAPPDPPVPEVLPARKPPPVFSFTGARGLSPMQAAGLPLETLPGEVSDQSGKEGFSHPEPSVSAAFTDNHAPLEGAPADSAAPLQRNAAEIGSALRSRLRRRLSRSDWRSFARNRLDRGGAPQASEPALMPRLQPHDPEEIQGPVASQSPAGPITVPPHDHASWAGNLPQPPDPLAVVVRLAERQSGPNIQEDDAPCLPALADLRAWLPDSSLPRAS